MNVLWSTWAFKPNPDGLIKKFKAPFCAKRDQQIQGIDFFETYATVVQWTTIHFMLVLKVLLELKSKKGDITTAFLHANLKKERSLWKCF